MSPEPARALLLDMDGVLVFSAEAWFRVYNETLAGFGHEAVSREDFDRIYGNGAQADRDRYMPERSVAEVDAAYRRLFPRHLDRVTVNGEARELLRELRVRSVATCVATNTSRALAEEVLRRVGLRDLVDEVASADEAGAGKPDPAVVRLASRRVGIPLEACLFIGDSRFDERAAEAAPVRFVGYRHGTADRVEDLRDILARPDVAGRPLAALSSTSRA